MSLVVSWITVIYHINKKSIIYICKASLSLLAGVRAEPSQAVRVPGMATKLALHWITVGRKQKAWCQPCTFRITKWRFLRRAYSSSDGQRSHVNVFLPWPSQGIGNQVENSKAEDKLGHSLIAPFSLLLYSLKSGGIVSKHCLSCFLCFQDGWKLNWYYIKVKPLLAFVHYARQNKILWLNRNFFIKYSGRFWLNGC